MCPPFATPLLGSERQASLARFVAQFADEFVALIHREKV
jgi:hypothetical protein